MAVPKTLVEYWQSEVDRIENQPPAPAVGAPLPPLIGELPDAKASRTAAAVAETAANVALAASGKAVADARSKVDAAKQALSAIPMPADSSPVLEEMRNALAAWRDAIAKNVANDTTLNDRRVERQRWADRVAALTDELATAQAALGKQTAIEKQIKQQIADAKAKPLKDAKTEADALLADQIRKDAENKVKGDFPYPPAGAGVSKFLQRARARRDLSAARNDAADRIAAEAFDQLATWTVSTTRKSALTAGYRKAYDDAVLALQALSLSTARLAAAKGVFKQIATRTAEPLTQAQSDELNVPARKTEREKALGLLEDRDKAQAGYFDAVVIYRKALHVERAKAPGKTDEQLVASVNSLKNKADELDPTNAGTKAETLEKARGKLTQQHRTLLETWFAAMPDTVWDELDVFDAAVKQLEDLSHNDPSVLVKNVQDAEADLAKNLDDSRAERLKEATLIENVKESTALTESARNMAVRRAQAAVRFVDEV